jgi:hypothetical protein
MTNILEIKRERLVAVIISKESDASLAQVDVQARHPPGCLLACHQVFAGRGDGIADRCCRNHRGARENSLAPKWLVEPMAQPAHALRGSL